MKNIREMFNISYFDNKELSLKEHCDIYSNIKKELVSILNKYDIKYVLAETEVIKDLSKENQELKAKINGVYEERTYLYNKLSTENEQLNSLVNSCQEEIRQLKKQVEENKDKINWYENFEINKTIDKLRLKHNTKQKEFIDYMNKTIEELECDDVDDEEMKGYLIQRIDIFKEILSKLKKIIGVSDDKTN